MIPPVLAAIHFGFPWFDILVGAGALVLAWEWTGLTGAGAVRGALIAVATVCAVLSMGWLAPLASIFILALGAVAILVIRNRLPDPAPATPKSPTLRRPLWSVAGIIYIGLPCVGLVWLRGEPESGGRETILWLFLVIWAADCGAYLFGRSIGGPLLAPRISPKKTWSGLVGGVACAGATGAAFVAYLEKDGFVPIALFSAFLGVVEQGGDLAESWIKRRAGQKDVSRLIPGHGGLFDRVDGLLAAILVVALVALAGGGEILAWM